MNLVKIVLVGLLSGLSICAFAQDAPAKLAPNWAKNNAQKLSKDLSLSAEQTTRVEELNTRYQAELEKAKLAKKEGERGGLRTLNAKRENDLKLILTPEQFEKHQAMQAERKELRKEGAPKIKSTN